MSNNLVAIFESLRLVDLLLEADLGIDGLLMLPWQLGDGESKGRSLVLCVLVVDLGRDKGGVVMVTLKEADRLRVDLGLPDRTLFSGKDCCHLNSSTASFSFSCWIYLFRKEEDPVISS